ncbi:MAG: ATP synthase F0 subunit C [Anaerovoracaceae bacterium]
METGLIALGAGIAAIGVIGGGIAIGTIGGKAVEAIARQPEAKSDITSTMILGIAFAEVTSLYALIVSILLIFVY